MRASTALLSSSGSSRGPTLTACCQREASRGLPSAPSGRQPENVEPWVLGPSPRMTQGRASAPQRHRIEHWQGHRFHRASSHVVTISPVSTSLASFKVMPMATSSSRMRSASLKFLALRALLRCSTSDFTCCRQLRIRRLDQQRRLGAGVPAASHQSPETARMRATPAPLRALPPLASLASSCRPAIASGVLRSSLSASTMRASGSQRPSVKPPTASLISAQRSSVACDSSSPVLVQSIGWR